MRSMVLKFGEHEVTLYTSDDLDLKIENSVQNKTNVYIESRDYIEPDGFELGDDEPNADLTDDELGEISESLSVRERHGLIADVDHDDAVALEELKQDMSEDDKSAYDELYESISEQPVLETNDFDLDGDVPVLNSDKSSDAFESSINDVLQTERSFLQEEEKNQKTVASAPSDYDNEDDDEDVNNVTGPEEDPDVIEDDSDGSTINLGKFAPEEEEDDDLTE